MKQLATWTTRLMMALIVAFGLGFVVFAEAVARQPTGDPGRADAIVALTGGQDRIDEAVRLLVDGHGTRLLISGVNTRTSKDALKAQAAAKAAAKKEGGLDAGPVETGSAEAPVAEDAEAAAKRARLEELKRKAAEKAAQRKKESGA